jgi:hypothetical protein
MCDFQGQAAGGAVAETGFHHVITANDIVKLPDEIR